MSFKPTPNKKKAVHPGELIIIKNPFEELQIVGVDIPESEEYSFAWCPRADEEVTYAFVREIEGPNEVYDPIHVSKNGTKYLVIGGRRRVKAARIIWQAQEQAGIPESDRVLLRALVHAGTPEELEQINIRENLTKKSLTLLQQAKLCDYRLRRNGYSYEACAKVVGIAEHRIRRLAKLLQCTPEVMEAFDDELLSLDLVDEFEKLERHVQNEALKFILEKELTGQHAKKYLKKFSLPEESQDFEGFEFKWGKKTFTRAISLIKKEGLASNPYIQGALDMIEWQAGIKRIGDFQNEDLQKIMEKALYYKLDKVVIDEMKKTPEQTFQIKQLTTRINENSEGIQVSNTQVGYTLNQLLKTSCVEKTEEGFCLKK